ncbi:MAG: hypothetical protein JXI43_14435 [Tissierellales bacterium]|nr:hypothetical protein [Tissierellales bacterium]
MGFLEWLFGKKPAGEQISPKSDGKPIITMEILPPVPKPPIDKSKFSAIGNSEPLCPYCGYHFDKMPQRKKACPNCKKVFYSRTRPLDNLKVLVTTDQLNEVERQNSIKNGSFSERQQNQYNKTRDDLRKRFGNEPSYSDVTWGFLNKEAQYMARRKDWGLYTNVIAQQANFLEREEQFKQALIFYQQLCYLDLNGPENIGGLGSDANFPSFNPETAFLPPTNVEHFFKLGTDMKMSAAEIKTIFIEHNTKIYKSLKLPVSPENAWQSIEKIFPQND